MTATTTKTRTITEHAQAAKAIRAELKAAFPTVTFRVTSKGYSGGDSVRVEWIDGPTDRAVDAITGKYQEGSFDSSCDLYSYTNNRDDIPQSRWVHTSRNYSPETRAAMLDLINKVWGLALSLDCYGGITGAADYWEREKYGRALNNASLICPDCPAHTMPADKFCPACGAGLDDTGRDDLA